jgi:hypothetical protein
MVLHRSAGCARSWRASLRGLQICADAMALAKARAEVATNRVMFWKTAGGPKGQGSSPLRWEGPHHDDLIVSATRDVDQRQAQSGMEFNHLGLPKTQVGSVATEPATIWAG